ncbi:hypothetical protein JCM11491_003340, partial [Sporobolomyces phaffii]
SDDGGPGLGFWWSINQRRFKFAHRSEEEWTDIAFVEALAILSALAVATSSFPELSRILVLTDSALSVYAFDTGRASPGLHSVVWAAYRLLDEKKVDLRVRHISGERNRTADLLSRVKTSRLPEIAEHFRIFNPPTHLIGLGGTPSLPTLVARADFLLEHHLQPSTLRAYRRAVKHWTSFVSIYALPWFPSTTSLRLFVAFISLRLKGVDSLLSGLAWYFAERMENWREIRSHPLVKKTIRATLLEARPPTKRTPPLRPQHLAILFN